MASDRPISKWPPTVGERAHYDSGHAITSWSAIVLGVFDDYQVALRRWIPSRGYRYFFESRYFWKLAPIRKGSLPKRSKEPAFPERHPVTNEPMRAK